MSQNRNVMAREDAQRADAEHARVYQWLQAEFQTKLGVPAVLEQSEKKWSAWREAEDKRAFTWHGTGQEFYHATLRRRLTRERTSGLLLFGASLSAPSGLLPDPKTLASSAVLVTRLWKAAHAFIVDSDYPGIKEDWPRLTNEVQRTWFAYCASEVALWSAQHRAYVQDAVCVRLNAECSRVMYGYLDAAERDQLEAEEVRRCEEELKKVFAYVMSGVGGKPATVTALRNSQQAWLAFRSADVTMWASQFETKANGGFSRLHQTHERSSQLLRDRIAELLLFFTGSVVLGTGSDLAASEKLLNSLWDYEKSVASTDTEQARAKRAQRTWLAYRDAELALWKRTRSNLNAVRARLTWERARHLASGYD
ncbi:lysozyme inhibitor LprI family protein [Armatimonas sp.]|uniref:lysozyme inhibitor LprI family protein n=1 Tax=Armatimonas sp. TaxID=1872638 RepID=UPI00286B7F47|nr:lysozyme inhibitor LprI family protein [Armatimonas sp.]